MAANGIHPAPQRASSLWEVITTPLLTILAALLPALSRWWLPTLPAGADTAIHFFRAVQLDWLIRQGIFYSRWLPDLVFGYGYPLFNYYGPLANYVIVFFYFLGLPLIPATLAAFALADLLGAFGAYLLARDTLGKLPGLIAAIAYAYSPYSLSSLYRGTLPEALCLGLLPWLLWTFYHLWHQPSPIRLASASLLLALYPMLNNPGSALAVPVLLFFLGALALSRPAQSLRSIGLALALGLALSAFVWLPLIAELQLVQIERAYDPAITNFHNNFLSLTELFAWPQPRDPQLIGAAISSGLGLPQLLLAGLAIVGIRGRTREQKFLLGLSALALPILVFLTLPGSVKIWETLPGLSLIQFPGRLLGPASLLTALLAGSAFTSAREDRSGISAVVAAVVGVMLFGFGWLYTAVDPSIPPQPALADIHAYEHRTGVVGTTSAAEFLPKWVEQRPPDNSLDYAQPPINRLNRDQLPAEVVVISETPGPLTQQVELDTPSSFTAVFNLFYFPGWTAAIDGQSVAVAPTPINGLLSFPVPAGRHTLALQFTDTPARLIGNLLSLAALLALGLILVHGKTPVAVDAGPVPARSEWSQSGGLTLALIGLAFFALKFLWLDHADSFFLQNRFDGQAVRDVQYPLDLTFGDQLQLLGYDLLSPQRPTSDTLPVTLYWRALQPLDSDWSVSVALEWQGHRLAQADAQHPAGLPTSRWQITQYAWDVHGLSPRPGTPPGQYDLLVTVYRQSDGVVLQPAAVKIGEVQLARPAQPAQLNSNLTAMPLGPIELIGADPTEAQATVGDILPLTLSWRANQTPETDMQIEFQFTGETGPAIYTQLFTPTRPDFGTSQWRAGDNWIGFLEVPIPVDLTSGYYFVEVNGPSGSRMTTRIQVAAPERAYTVPPIPQPLSVEFEEAAKLLGWQYADNQLTLYWQSTQITDTRYTVFIHALNAAGDIIAQRDSHPVNGRRPTTSWLPPEIVTDVYDFNLPAETAVVRIGLYDPVTNLRLLTTAGDEFVIIRP